MPHQGSSLEKLDVRTVEPIRWTSEGVVMLDQLKLPGEVVYHAYTDYREVAQAIKNMVIRGAPAIGIAAAMGVALGVERSEAKTLPELQAEFRTICDALACTRPTAVDLFGQSNGSNAALTNSALRLDKMVRGLLRSAKPLWKKRKNCIRNAGKPTNALAGLARNSCRRAAG